ncbi:hypothetical protein Zmor_010812 [Zophobas morio]|uniref:Uncharacterized protein n=1 Tax=Zophobas morio TaxID=2755281 RepID=A0AA38MJ35_9CUCU|nr:hypothetical protein Zmor_010812 [Zophobas morio]
MAVTENQNDTYLFLYTLAVETVVIINCGTTCTFNNDLLIIMYMSIYILYDESIYVFLRRVPVDGLLVTLVRHSFVQEGGDESYWGWYRTPDESRAAENFGWYHT